MIASQSLIGDDVMILDSGEEVYVWEGAESDAEEKVRGLDMAKKYLDADPTSRWRQQYIYSFDSSPDY